MARITDKLYDADLEKVKNGTHIIKFGKLGCVIKLGNGMYKKYPSVVIDNGTHIIDVYCFANLKDWKKRIKEDLNCCNYKFEVIKSEEECHDLM